MRTGLAAAACFVVLAAVAIAQQFPLRQNVEVLTEAPMRPVKVKDGLYIIRGPAMPCMTGCRPGDKGDGLIHESGDVAVRVTADGLIVVDDKFASQAADVFAQVKTVSPLPVKYVLNTHHHADHAGGNQYARDTFGVDIIAQKNIRANFLRIKQPGAPNITFGNEAEVYLGGAEVRLHWFGRAHTNGDTVIEFPDLKTIHTGDLIIDAIPVIDYPGGGSAIEFLTTIDRMLTLDFDTAILGHGRTMTKQEVRDYRMRFAEMNRRMKALIDRGMTKDRLKTWEQARAALKLEELGWENTVSWTTFFAGFPAYFDEIAASKIAQRRLSQPLDPDEDSPRRVDAAPTRRGARLRADRRRGAARATSRIALALSVGSATNPVCRPASVSGPINRDATAE